MTSKSPFLSGDLLQQISLTACVGHNYFILIKPLLLSLEISMGINSTPQYTTVQWRTRKRKLNLPEGSTVAVRITSFALIFLDTDLAVDKFLVFILG